MPSSGADEHGRSELLWRRQIVRKAEKGLSELLAQGLRPTVLLSEKRGERKETEMAAIGFAFPILPGRTEEAKQLAQQLQGPGRQAHEESRRRLGITEEQIWIQPMPQGDLALFYLESEHPEQVFPGLASSSDPVDLWLRDELAIQGLDLAQLATEPLFRLSLPTAPIPGGPSSPTLRAQWGDRVKAGLTVQGADGLSIGHIIQVQPHGESFLLERSDASEYLVQVPFGAIQAVSETELILKVPANQIDQQGWMVTRTTGAGT